MEVNLLTTSLLNVLYLVAHRALECITAISNNPSKTGCERNHVELRKILPKGCGIRFDQLDCRDMAVLMSHLNSEPRASLLGATPLSLLKATLKEDAGTLMDALGIEEISYKQLDMTYSAINKERVTRGLDPIL